MSPCCITDTLLCTAGLFSFLVLLVQLCTLVCSLRFVLELQLWVWVWHRVQLGVGLEVRLGISIFCAEGAAIFGSIPSTFEVNLKFQAILGLLYRGRGIMLGQMTMYSGVSVGFYVSILNQFLKNITSILRKTPSIWGVTTTVVNIAPLHRHQLLWLMHHSDSISCSPGQVVET